MRPADATTASAVPARSTRRPAARHDTPLHDPSRPRARGREAPAPRYTVHDTPATVARIERDLDLITAAVRAADPGLSSLVLTGGFARGEGAVRGGEPVNDYDLVAVRAAWPGRVAYDGLADRLSDDIGFHVDLAPVARLRLRWTPRSIFWYETALRGRVLWGEDVLPRIRVRSPDQIDRGEGMRLLVNRAAGLLLGMDGDGHEVRLQAAKAILAAADAHLLAAGAFPPSQTERWHHIESERAAGQRPDVPPQWLAWAFTMKTAPDAAETLEPARAWRAARRILLDAVPRALAHAGAADIDAYARRDGILEHVVYARRAGRSWLAARNGAREPGRNGSDQAPAAVHRVMTNPTGRVRAATLRMLYEASFRRLPPDAAQRCLAGLADHDAEPMAALRTLRRLTLQ